MKIKMDSVIKVITTVGVLVCAAALNALNESTKVSVSYDPSRDHHDKIRMPFDCDRANASKLEVLCNAALETSFDSGKLNYAKKIFNLAKKSESTVLKMDAVSYLEEIANACDFGSSKNSIMDMIYDI